MAEDPKIIEAKIANAIQATDAFVKLLELEELEAWAARFREIAAALRSADATAAIRLYKLTSFGGMGSLSDHFAQDQQRFDEFWGKCSKTISNLRLYMEYGANRPLVEVRDA